MLSGFLGCRTLQTLNLDNLGVSGTLPAAWANTGAFENLNSLYLDANNLTGSLPDAWARQGAFPRLQSMYGGATLLRHCLLAGACNPACALAGAAPWPTTVSTAPCPRVGAFRVRCLWSTTCEMGCTMLLPSSCMLHLTDFRSVSRSYLVGNTFTGPLPSTWGAPGAMPFLKYL